MSRVRRPLSDPLKKYKCNYCKYGDVDTIFVLVWDNSIMQAKRMCDGCWSIWYAGGKVSVIVED